MANTIEIPGTQVFTFRVVGFVRGEVEDADGNRIEFLDNETAKFYPATHTTHRDMWWFLRTFLLQALADENELKQAVAHNVRNEYDNFEAQDDLCLWKD